MIEIDKTKYQRLSWIKPNMPNNFYLPLTNTKNEFEIEVKIKFDGLYGLYIGKKDLLDNKFSFGNNNNKFVAYKNSNYVLGSIDLRKTNEYLFTISYLKGNCKVSANRLDVNFDSIINFKDETYSTNYFNVYFKSSSSDSESNTLYYIRMYGWDATQTKREDHYIIPVKQLSDNKIGLYNTFTKVFTEIVYSTIGDPIVDTLNFSKVKKIVIPEGNVLSITKDGEEDPLWSAKNIYGYGIKWNTGEKPTRIGNMNLHKTLPIQSNFKCCVHQGTDIQYYLNEQDSRFVSADIRESFTFDITEMQPTACDGLPSGVISCEESSIVKVKFINKTLFSNYRFLYSYVYLRGNTTTIAMAIGRIVHIDVETGEAYIDDSIEIQTSNYIYNESKDMRCTVWGVLNDQDIQDCTVELGASLNGYDGELGVDTGAKFYQWSVDKEGNGNEVWISQYKCVPYAKEVKRHIIGCNRACVLNSAFNDDKWGWIGALSSNTSVNVINYNSKLRGGSNIDNFSKYLGDDNFRCQFNKGRTDIDLTQMRQFTQKLANHQVLYKQLWEAIVWCYYIEYCSLNVKDNFNNALTTEGYHQGGLGQSYSIGEKYLNAYNDNKCLTPCDYTLHLGNNTGIRNRKAKNFTFNTINNLIWKNNIWSVNNIIWNSSVDNNDAKCKITKIAVNNAYIQAESNNVSGTITYKVEGLTDGQYIIFNREKGNLTITADGTYTIEWGNDTVNRRITFGIAQDSCEIYIEAIKAIDNYVNATQLSWDIPHWRGFNVFWYGDIWINIENFLSKYDTTKQRRIYYWTDDITKFDNTIDNKEHSLEDSGNIQNDWVNEFNLSKQGNLLVRNYKVNNYINTFHFDNKDSQIHTTFIGGHANYSSWCSLGFLDSRFNIYIANKYSGFVTCTIID